MKLILSGNLKHSTRFSNADKILAFYKSLQPKFLLSEGVMIMNPFDSAYAWTVTTSFYTKYYNDNLPRKMIFGINPGRFGGGVTGIPFTDPVRLEENCGIENSFKKQAELSSIFIYKMIDAYGGPELFYKDFFITALSPLGFIKNGINLNYYDDKQLLVDSRAFIVDCIVAQKEIFPSELCYCLGEGTNYKIFKKMNSEEKFFTNIIPLPHPRWIMQYRRKRMDEFVQLYVARLKEM